MPLKHAAFISVPAREGGEHSRMVFPADFFFVDYCFESSRQSCVSVSSPSHRVLEAWRCR